MNLSGIQVLQFLAMFAMPITISYLVRDKETGAVWSCVVIAILMLGVSVAEVAKVLAASKPDKPALPAATLPRHPMDQ